MTEFVLGSVLESVRPRCIAILAVSVLLGGCAGAARIPEDSFYRLEIAAPAIRLPAPALTGVLVVQSGTAAPVYRDRALLYSEPETPARLQRYHYQYWIDTPPQLVQRSLADYLRAAGVATDVVLPEEGIDARYRLRVDIERFEHRRGRAGGEVAVGLRLTLAERASGTLLAQEFLQGDAAVQGNDFSAVAAAYRQALTDLYGRILTRVRALDSTGR
ncbi:MAG: membrane integrity-associated transporter subunit PqiC [Gammaproteobacteria bacterium]|nr:membrane integrity-associated transporter subunit PqiC [Gammaproteobacteria bacterium]